MQVVKEGIAFFEDTILNKKVSDEIKFNFIRENLNKFDVQEISKLDSDIGNQISEYIQDVSEAGDYHYAVFKFMQIYKALKDLEFRMSPLNIDKSTHFSYYKNIEKDFFVNHKRYSKERSKTDLQNVELAEHSVLNPKSIDSENLHKFESKVNGYPIFRSGIGIDGNNKNHVIVYTLMKRHDNHVIVFLRCLKHKQWERVLNSRFGRNGLGRQIIHIKKEFGFE